MATQAPTMGTLARTMILNVEAAKIASIMARFDRRKLETFLEAGVELLDAIDGDDDREANGDEGDHNNSKDCFIEHERGGGPGCMISDPDYGGEEAGEREEGI